ncbi:MAG: CsbD family protein [Acidimicrobiales bacterium]
MKIRNRAKNMSQISKGKTKEVTGKAVGNPKLESDGANDQHVGHLKQVGEKVNDAIEEL